MEVEGKRTRREIAAMEKELAALRLGVGKGRESQIARRTSAPRLIFFIIIFFYMNIK